MVAKVIKITIYLLIALGIVWVVFFHQRFIRKDIEVWALNKTNNWNFASNATGWSVTNGRGTDICGSTTQTTSDTSMVAPGLAYDGTIGNPAGSLKAVTTAGKGSTGRAMAYQTFTVPGSGTVKMKGSFDYYVNTAGNYFNNGSWIRVDIYDSGNSTYVGNVGCVAFTSNQVWQNSGLGAEINLTGGVSYTIRITYRGKLASNSNGSITLAVDNIIVNLAPTGVTISNPADTTNVNLSWTASTAGTGANGINATTPYKVYRSTTSPVTVSNFLSNSGTNSYSDTTSVGNTTYYYAISDVDTASIESPLSNEVSILTRPGAPTNINFSNLKDTTLRVSWTAPTGGAASYRVERCSGSSCSNFVEIANNVTNAYYDDSNLSGGTLYRYRVRGNNNTGDGAYSSIGEVTTGIVSITMTTDGVVNFGFLPAASTISTIGLSDTQIIQNNGTLTENVNIMTSNASGGTAWNLAGTPGNNAFVYEFSNDSGAGWTAFSSPGVYQTFTTSLTQSSFKNIDLRLTAPTASSDYQQKTITITLQATAQ